MPVLGLFSPKLKTFSQGRAGVFKYVTDKINQGDNIIWFHAASLGEYEQGVPVIEEIKKQYPQHKILLTFFSPSGYTIKKNNNLAHITTYLPLDTYAHAKHFIELVNPKMVFFIKYEFWPNYLKVLGEKQIRTFLISGVFRKSQPFFKVTGRWMINSLQTFEHMFLQNQDSVNLARELGFTNITLSGDTRFDRVSHQLKVDNRIDFLEQFIDNKLCLVCGSTWTEDEDFLIHFINKKALQLEVKVILAPHQINTQKIANLKQKLTSKVISYTDKEQKQLEAYDVFILDTIGYLGKAYYYANVAYVGGAAGETGLHNILEPATFGLPILCGPNIQKFPEAIRLRQLAGLYVVNSQKEATNVLNTFFTKHDYRQKTGMITGHFVQSNTGATQTIIHYLNT